MSVRPEWASIDGSEVSIISGDRSIIVSPLTVFYCEEVEASCLGANITRQDGSSSSIGAALRCAPGHSGELCGICADGYTKSDRDTACEKCGDWSVVTGISLLLVIVLGIVAVLHIHKWYQ